MTPAARGARSRVDGHAAEGIWAANGSNEILTQLLQAYGGPGRARGDVRADVPAARAAVLAHPHRGRDALACRRLRAGRGAGGGGASTSTPDVVFVCSPNNPTGNAQPLSAIAALAERLPRALVIVDEAYGEFAPAASAQAADRLAPEHRVVRTFSKAFALAGARIGYVLAAPEVVEDLQRVRLPYHLSALTQTAGIVALRHRGGGDGAAGGDPRSQRDRIVARAAPMPRRRPCTRATRTSCCSCRRATPSTVWQGLLDRGVLVRDMTAVVPNALRVTAGAEHETDLFLRGDRGGARRMSRDRDRHARHEGDRRSASSSSSTARARRAPTRACRSSITCCSSSASTPGST